MEAKWNTLEHNGVLFPKAYEPVGITLKHLHTCLSNYGKAEEMLFAYAARLETEYVKDATFNKNFVRCLRPHLPEKLRGLTFPDDFAEDLKDIFAIIQNKKELAKNKTKEEKKAEEVERAMLKEKYGYATLNGKRMPLGAYLIEPAGIFIGRGKNPLHGMWKEAATPEDVTINISKGSPVPLAPTGHHWKAIVENTKAYWIAYYIIPVVNKRKFILFGATSDVKQGADQAKFQKAITLLKNWERLKKYIERNVSNGDPVIQQAALVAYLIMNLGIRVGDEKDDDEADTVGASTLRIEHVKLDGNKLTLNFLGKDSIRYKNSMEVIPSVAKSLQKLTEGKKKSSEVFPFVTSHTVNAFLKDCVEGVSAKQFRTAYGSMLLCQALRDVRPTAGLTDGQKLAVFNECNKAVAEKLNHKKAPAKNFDEQVDGMKDTLTKLRSEYREIEIETLPKISDIDTELTTLRAGRQTKEIKDKISKLKEKKAKLKSRLENKKSRIIDVNLKIKMKEETKDIALGTSKTNYSSPRVTVSWCKAKGLPIEKVFSKSLQEKFAWAMDTDEDYFMQYPNVEA